MKGKEERKKVLKLIPLIRGESVQMIGSPPGNVKDTWEPAKGEG